MFVKKITLKQNVSEERVETGLNTHTKAFHTCFGSAPLCRLPSARTRGVLPLLQKTQRDDRHPPEQEDLRRQALHQCRLRALRPLLRGRQHAQRHHRPPFPVHL